MSSKRNNLRTLVLGLTMIGSTAFVTAGNAAVSADLRAGIYPDGERGAIGAGLLTPIGNQYRWHFNPNAEMAFGDRDVVSFNGDVHYDLAYQQPTSVWLGAGPAVILRETARDERETGLGMNVIAGFGKTHGDVRPFGQLKGVMSDESGLALMGGVRF